MSRRTTSKPANGIQSMIDKIAVLQKPDIPLRELSSLPENIMKAINDVNRDLNYKSRARSVMIYGEPGAGKTFMLQQLSYNIDSLPSLTENRVVRFLTTDNLSDYIDNNDVEPDAVIDNLANEINNVNNNADNDTRLIVAVDDFHLGVALMNKCKGTSFLIEMDNESMSHAMSEHESDVDKMEVVYVENNLKFSELLSELNLVNGKFKTEYHCDSLDDNVVKAFTEELVLQVYPSRSSSFRRTDEIELPIGYIIDQLEFAYVRALEPPYNNGRITTKSARLIAKEAFQSNPVMDSFDDDIIASGYDSDDPIASLLSDDAQVSSKPSRKKKPVKPLKYNDPVHLADRLKTTVINQDKAVDMVSKAIMIDAAKMKPKNKPVASFLFLGPSGVGKTQLAKSLAQTLFDKPVNLVRIDCSEFSEKHTVSRLFGAPPGYAGFDNGGELTNAVREHPQSVVLLDEVEKAHSDVWNSFLQVFDDARLTDGQGVTTDFSHCIFILTGNLGTKEADNMKTTGFGDNSAKDDEAIYAKSMKEFFRPEFINRLDGICYFNKLRRCDYERIVDIKMKSISHIIKDNYNVNVNFIVDSKSVDDILHEAKSLNHGAREIEQVIKNNIILPMSEKILQSDISFKDNQTIKVHDDNGNLILEVVNEIKD